MTDMVFRIVAFGVLVTVPVVLLKRFTPEISLLLTGAACLCILSLLAARIQEAMGFFQDLLAQGGVSEQLLLPLLKTMAIAIVCKVGGDLCRDNGQTAMGNLLETAGTAGAILVSLPLFRSAWELLQML